MEKRDWRKNEKEIYNPGTKPQVIKIPKQKYIMIDGTGNPNSTEFSEKVGVLMSLSYGIKMMLKKDENPCEGYFDYSVYPLEGKWSFSEEELKRIDSEKQNNTTLNKDEFVYTIMVRQPDYVTKEIYDRAFENVKKKKKDLKFLDEARFEEDKEKLCVHIIHNGPFDNENISFDKMKKFIEENNLKIKSFIHREIYLKDSRKCAKDKLKTILRYEVEEI